ncbi:MAG: aldo/keto reductase [Alphaproteobacteria bacterium]|nr:aldo/keto reductase [Alphaproteobacteria bacterium]
MKISTTALPSGEKIPTFGIGTWRMGEQRAHRRAETDAVRLAIDLGVTLIDTAEMYGDGHAEEIVGEAIRRRRDGLFIVSKVLPSNASAKGTITACDRSLKRLGIDCIDLYLLHWPGSHPLAATIGAFEELRTRKKIRHWGVSNFDLPDMKELSALVPGAACASNQVLYNLARRGIEHSLVPWSLARGMPIMAYSPIDQARLLSHRSLKAVATSLNATPSQVALAWLLRQPATIVIPKATDPDHLRENLGSLGIALTDQALRDLDRAFPPPRGPVPLEVL